MYNELATRLSVKGDGTVAVSQPVSMDGANAAQFDFTIYESSSSTVTVKLQGSNDLQNWSDLTVSKTGNAVGHSESSLETNIPCAYVRLHYKVTTGSGNIVLSAGINTVQN